MAYESRIVKILINKEDEQLFAETVTSVEITDEAAGEFLTVSQVTSEAHSSIKIDPEEWPTLREVIDQLMKECRV